MTFAQPCSSTSTRDSAFHLANSGVTRFMPFGIHDVDQFAVEVGGDQGQQQAIASIAGRVQRARALSPRNSCKRHRQRRKQDGVGAADEVEQRNQRQAGQRSAQQIGAIELCDTSRMPRENDGEQQPRDKERHC